MGISGYAQIVDGGWNWSLTGLVLSTFGCMAISLVGLVSGRYSLAATDWWFFFGGVVCMLFYILAKDPFTTTLLAVFIDLLLGIPTLINAYRNPHLEKTNAWTYGTLSWVLTLGLCIGEDFLLWMFPIYLFSFNGVMVLLTLPKRISRMAHEDAAAVRANHKSQEQ